MMRLSIIVALVLLNGYSFGAGMVERFVNYQTWHLIPPSAFQAYHRAQSRAIQIVIVLPLAASFLLQMLLLRFYSSFGIGFWTIWTMLTATLTGALSTIFIQLPIHRDFDSEGYSTKSMAWLLSSDWIRKAADIVRILATGALLEQITHHQGSIY